MKLWLRLIWALASWRSRPKLHMNEVGIREFRVWPTDLDVFNHMNNGVFLTLLDLGRYDLSLRAGLWQHWKKLGWYPIVVASNITFRKSLLPWQKFQIETKVVGWDDEAFYFEQRFVANAEICAVAIVRIRFLKRVRGIVTPPEVLAESNWDGKEPKLPKWISDWAKASLLPRLKEPAPSIWN